MRSSIHSPDSYFMKMKKKPALQAILDHIDEYSIEQLQGLSSQPLWIREQLVKLRSGRHAEQLNAKAIQMAEMMPAASPAPTTCEVRQWQGNTCWMRSARSMELEVRQGDLFYLLNPQELTVLCEYTAVTINDWVEFLANSTSLGTHDYITYKNMISDQKSKLIPSQVIDLTPEDNSPIGRLAGLGVRIG